jgi:predicted AlkP superfamily phosphohydrolase/phosphomutase
MSAAGKRSPVVLLGFDAMDPGLTRRMARAGRLPAFASLFDDSARAAVRTPPGLLVGAVWPSLWTGRWPSEHGFYCFRQLVNGTYLVRRFTPNDVVDPPFWMTLADEGRRVCALDVPLSPLTRPSNGLHVIDWGTHDRMLEPAVWPAEMEAQIEELVGPHPIVGKCDGYAERLAWAELLEDLRRGIDKRTSLNFRLLRGDEWDFFATVYSESHCAGHQFWWAHDPTHPHYSQGGSDLLAQVYEGLDAALGRLLARIPPNATTMIVLSHGVGVHHDADHLLAEILQRLDDAYGAPQRWLVRREQLLRRVDRARERWSAEGRRRPSSPKSVDSSRRFFKIPNNEYNGAIRINLRGREPRGRVERGEELEQLLTWLEHELLELRDPGTRRPLVRRVLRARDAYSGRQLDALPDLLVDWERSTPITAAASVRIGVVRGEYTGIRSADHRPGGLLIARGPGIDSGPIGGIAVVDIAPTICALLDADGGEFDGAPVTALTRGHQR